MAKRQKKPSTCKWCERPILYDSSVSMWYFTRPSGTANYYCTQDVNPERGQHFPTPEERSNG